MPNCDRTDVVIVGGGNAGFVAALAAADRGRRVVLLEAASQEQAGGNSYFTAGATRLTHEGLEDLRPWIEPDERHATTEVPPYSYDDYVGDLAKVTEGRGDADMAHVLASEVTEVIRWLHDGHGMKYRLMYERQAYVTPEGGYLFWGGLHVGNVGGGEGMISHYRAAAEHAGIEIRYSSPVTDLVLEGDAVVGVQHEGPQGKNEVRADSVVIASGGFEASAELRAKYLGPGWEKAKVRGTPFNTGTMLEHALGVGAARAGDWSTCHATAWDAWFPENESNRELTNRLTRQSYPLGIVVNRRGERFVDEGADFRNYTYAKYGGEILRQPGEVAFQVFDAATRPMLRTEEYDMPGVSVVEGDTLHDLADGMGIDKEKFVRTVTEFNNAIRRDVPADPTIRDNRSSEVRPRKSNWAYALETPPFYAYPVTCGITFTFGGLKGDLTGRVLREDGTVIEGLYACGEALGGLFSGNYPGGSGLAAGAVWGRRVGSVA